MARWWETSSKQLATEWRTDPATRAYIERRLAEGRTSKQIRRCLKRYVGRQIFRTPAAAHAAPGLLASAA